MQAGRSDIVVCRQSFSSKQRIQRAVTCLVPGVRRYLPSVSPLIADRSGERGGWKTREFGRTWDGPTWADCKSIVVWYEKDNHTQLASPSCYILGGYTRVVT